MLTIIFAIHGLAQSICTHFVLRVVSGRSILFKQLSVHTAAVLHYTQKC